jgi:hypothetical protein
MTVLVKRDLMEMGTRFEHYNELREVFMSGIETINNMRPAYRSAVDEVIKNNLNIAVTMIDKQLAFLSGLSVEEHSGSNLDRQLHSIEMQRQAAKKLLKGANDDDTQDSSLRRFEENPST